MKIKTIHISAFGKLKDKKISFTDGLNIIYGRNESGKSTISAFIEAMLYSFPPRSDRDKYFPWDNSTPSGSMTIEKKGESITLYRKFGATAKSDFLEITPPVDIFSFIPSSRESYRKSVYCREDFTKDFGTSSEINAKISNIMETGDEALDASAAIERLEKFRRSLKAKRGNGGMLNNTENNITRLENELSVAHREFVQLATVRDELSKREDELEKLTQRLNIIEEQKSLIDSSHLEKTDRRIALQQEYIAQFPSFDEAPPKAPAVFSKALLLYIICALVPFIIGFIHYSPLLLIAPVPLIFYFILFAFKKRVFKAKTRAFLDLFNCSALEEYYKMLSDKKAAVDYYNALINERAGLSDTAALYANLQTESNNIYKEIVVLKDDISHLQDELSMFSCRSVEDIRADLDYYLTLREELTKKLKATDAAIAAIEHAKYCISKDFTPRITTIAMDYLNRIAPKPGREVHLSTDFTLTLTDPLRQDITSSSFGFKEEMYLCFQIALSEFVYGDFPLILDDPFIGSDNYREKAIFDLLSSISKQRQVIVFTNRCNDYFSQSDCNWVDITPSNDV